MMYSTIKKYGKTLVIGFAGDLTNDGRLEVLELEIDGKDCSPALEFGNLTDVFEDLVLNQKEEVSNDLQPHIKRQPRQTATARR